MVFGLGILWTGLSAYGALAGLVVGFIMGMAKFIVGNVYSDPKCGEADDRPGFAKMHFMYYGELQCNKCTETVITSYCVWLQMERMKMEGSGSVPTYENLLRNKINM